LQIVFAGDNLTYEGFDIVWQLQKKDVNAEKIEKITVVTLMTNLAKNITGKLKEPCVAVLDA
jgi:hypothetical protein